MLLSLSLYHHQPFKTLELPCMISSLAKPNIVVVLQVFGLFNDVVYAAGAYLIYMDWKANPTGCAAPAPPTV